jgi:hypothetical protein
MVLVGHATRFTEKRGKEGKQRTIVHYRADDESTVAISQDQNQLLMVEICS